MSEFFSATLCSERYSAFILCVYAVMWRLFSILFCFCLYYFVLPLKVNKVVQCAVGLWQAKQQLKMQQTPDNRVITDVVIQYTKLMIHNLTENITKFK